MKMNSAKNGRWIILFKKFNRLRIKKDVTDGNTFIDIPRTVLSARISAENPLIKQCLVLICLFTCTFHQILLGLTEERNNNTNCKWGPKWTFLLLNMMKVYHTSS